MSKDIKHRQDLMEIAETRRMHNHKCKRIELVTHKNSTYFRKIKVVIRSKIPQINSINMIKDLTNKAKRKEIPKNITHGIKDILPNRKTCLFLIKLSKVLDIS